MASHPRITILGWNPKGPAYEVHRSLSGRRNRRLRRQGKEQRITYNEEAAGHSRRSPESFMVFYSAAGGESWAFNKGHVYEVLLSIDGHEQSTLVDARKDYRIEEYRPNIDVIEIQPHKKTSKASEDAPPEPSTGGSGKQAQEDE